MITSCNSIGKRAAAEKRPNFTLRKMFAVFLTAFLFMGSSLLQPGLTKPAHTKSSDTQSEQTQPGYAQPGYAQPSHTRSSYNQSFQTHHKTEQTVSFRTTTSGKNGFCPERLERLSRTLNEYADKQRLSGGVVLVKREGQPVFFEVFGKKDVESDIPMPRDAIFRIASQTKAIISVAVMMLQEEGKLLISDPVGKYLPEFEHTTVAVKRKQTASGNSKTPENNGRKTVQDDTPAWEIVSANRQITIRDLLTHSAGIGYGYGTAAELWEEAGIQGWYFANRDESVRETVRRMASLPFDAQPGERFVYGYSNDILGALIEEITGQPLDLFLRDNIFKPLKMHDTYFFLPEDKAGRLATVYSATDDGEIIRAPDPGGAVGQGHYVEGPRKSFSGGAGLVSTATDYGRFLQMMLNGGVLDGQRILSPRTIELMTVNHLTEIPFRPGLGFGLGFDVVTDPGARGVPGAIGDYGWGGAYHSTYWVSPQDQLVVVFFTQLIPSRGSDIRNKLRALIYQALIDP